MTRFLPQLETGVSITPFEGAYSSPRFIARAPDRQSYLLINSVSRALLGLLDGRRNIDELVAELRRQSGVELAADRLEVFLDLCQANHLLVLGTWRDGADNLKREGVRRRRRLGLYRDLLQGDRLLTHLLDRRRLWWNPLSWSLGAILLLAGLAFLLAPPPAVSLVDATQGLRSVLGKPHSLLLLALVLGQFTLHEFGHALACGLVGARSSGFGVGLALWIFPVAYTNTTDVYSVPSRWKRIFVSAAGPLVDLACLGAAAFVIWFATEPTVKATASAYSAVARWALLFNLNPFFVRFDGYWILSDLLGYANLRRVTFGALFTSVLRSLGVSKAPDPLAATWTPAPRDRRLLLVYTVISLAWTAWLAAKVAVTTATAIPAVAARIRGFLA